MDESLTSEDFAVAFGLTEESSTEPQQTQQDPTAQDPPAAAEAADPPQDHSDNNASSELPEGGDGGSNNQNPPVPDPVAQRRASQANQAFARMRTDNAAMLKTLQQTASILGIDPKLPPDQLSRLIQQKATEAQARRNNVDPEIMKRLNQLEDVNARYQAQEREKALANDLLAIRNKFGATDDDMLAFVQALDSENYNPFAPGANNLVTEFISRNFDKIIQNKVDAAVRAEQERAAKGSGASAPAQKQGQENKEEQKISTQADFDAFMNSLTNNN